MTVVIMICALCKKKLCFIDNTYGIEDYVTLCKKCFQKEGKVPIEDHELNQK